MHFSCLYHSQPAVFDAGYYRCLIGSGLVCDAVRFFITAILAFVDFGVGTNQQAPAFLEIPQGKTECLALAVGNQNTIGAWRSLAYAAVVIRSTRELREGDRVYCMPCMSRLIVTLGEGGRLEATVSY